MPNRRDRLTGEYTAHGMVAHMPGQRLRTAPPLGHAVRPRALGPAATNLLSDILVRMQAGKGAGYERWAKVFNLKEMAKTLIYLQEQGITEYGMLEEQTATATAAFHDLSAQIKAAETCMAEINDLQKHIGNSNRTRDLYQRYKASRYSKIFRAEHEGAILLHQAAKKAFDALGTQKLPTIKALQTEYARLATEKKRLYRDYRQARDKMRSLQVAKQNTDQLLRSTPASKEQDRQR